MSEKKEATPHWDLSNIYSGLEAQDLQSDLEQLKARIEDLEELIARHGVGKLPSVPEDLAPLVPTMEEVIRQLNATLLLAETLNAYIYGFVSTDSYNRTASRRLSEIEQLSVPLKRCQTRFSAWVGSLGPALERICSMSLLVAEHRQVLQDAVEQSQYLMDTQLEDLASELMLSGGGSMWKLQGNATSQLKVPFSRNGNEELLPMTVIRNLAFDPREEVRRRAYETELKVWESIREPVAFSLNGVKGSAVTLARWRGREDVLHESLDRNQIDRPTLDALLSSIREAFPIFRRYLRNKAHRLGKDVLPWWDLFAPVGKTSRSYTWNEAGEFIVLQFGRFSGDLADFATRAFRENWIDAEPRDGKRGGAFCMGVPGREESRILTNFDGSFDQLVTVAHELGHGYHTHCQKGLPMMRRGAPMTLAETASIFCETIVFNAALDSATPEEQVNILENQLAGATQVTVDISSRFLFESEVVRRRAEAELSADDLCQMMLEAQKQTYGDSLDVSSLHPYMWVMKPHYYQADLNFYNFPYAFGQLFGLGMYAIYLREPGSFLSRYQDLLRSTGAGKVADLAGRFGIDVRSRDFWRGSLRILEEQVNRYVELDR